MKPPRPLVTLAATTVVVAVSGAVALGAAWPIRNGPAGTSALVTLLAFGISLMVGVSASEPVMRRTAARRDRAAPAPPWVSGPAPAPAPVPVPASPPAPPAPVGDGQGPGRCFGCLRLEQVAGTGLLTVAESTVPLHLCRWCLEYLESWHAREAARLGVEREPSSTA